MTEPRGPPSTNADLAAVAAALVLFDAVALAPHLIPGTIRAALVACFLLVAPGYVAVAALFPGPTGGDGPSALERLVLGVGASVGCVVAVGLVAEGSGVGVRFGPLLVGINAVTIGAVAAAASRRRARRGGATVGKEGGRVAGFRRFLVGDGRVDLGLTIAVVVCLGALLGAIALDPGEERTAGEASLLAEQDGDLVAAGYPTELAVGEATTLHLAVGDGREESSEATVVVTLDELEDGTVSASTAVDRFVLELPDSEPVVTEHEVVPPIAGEDLRLTYLVYFGAVPDDPAPATADRQVHLRVTVAE
ncbi:DUF1616 domain-containing protein [Saliphagus sp. LR7]|uniref:DUF1616 domain-containing protein n=1 Tax=Saliphagus sp. LR7 TaxID=2282654 RepID=UPI000DF8181A|nr:DUF1616 domain-containing protein [Saliphagus sp. LR7]